MNKNLCFRTIVHAGKAPFEINHQSTILFMGSCFSENIGEKLITLKFNVDLNPFGIIFNPASIAICLERIIQEKFFVDNELVQYNDIWHSMLHHSQFSSLSKSETLEKINHRLQTSIHQLKTADYLFLTFGTAYVYLYKPTNQIVANCHKIPASNFERRLLTVSEIVETYRLLISSIKSLNNQIKIIFTVSPVRHLSDGANGNNVSKATLLLAVHQLCAEGYGYYFPAYEIVCDDLRDYRFYAKDLVHPSDEAIEYIFDNFSDAYFSESTISLNKEIMEVHLAMQHKLEFPEHPSVNVFKTSMLKKIDNLVKQYPFLNFKAEIEYFSQL